MSDITPSQTVGPYFAYGLTPRSRYEWRPEYGKHLYDWKETVGNDLVTPDASGERIRIEGAIIDGDGRPIPDAMIEIWQADAQGRYAHPRDQRALPNATFKGFGRSACDTEGVYCFDTIKPGRVPSSEDQQQAPHIVVAIYARGMLRQLYTRLYFSDEKSNAEDPVLNLVPQERRGTLIAHKKAGGDKPVYRFDIHVQGENETVFFEI